MNGEKLDYRQGRAKVKSEENNMIKEITQLAEFLRFAKDPEDKDSLLHTICKRFPADSSVQFAAKMVAILDN